MKISKKIAVALALCLVICAAMVTVAITFSPKDLSSTVKNGVVCVAAYDESGTATGWGTGFAVGDNAKDFSIVTNYHVVNLDSANSTIRVYYSDRDSDFATGTVAYFDEEKDLAIIKLDEVAGNIQPLTLVPSSFVKNTQGVYSFGFVGDTITDNSGNFNRTDITVSYGIISNRLYQYGVKCYQVDLALSPGESGGPLVNEKGEVVGINTRRLEEKNSVSYSILSDELIGLLGASGLSFRQSSMDTGIFYYGALLIMAACLVCAVVISVVTFQNKSGEKTAIWLNQKYISIAGSAVLLLMFIPVFVIGGSDSNGVFGIFRGGAVIDTGKTITKSHESSSNSSQTSNSSEPSGNSSGQTNSRTTSGSSGSSSSEQSKTIVLNKSELTLPNGQSQPLTATYNGSPIAVTWNSANPSVASVDQNGTVTTLMSGSTVITATAGDGKSAACSLTVTFVPDYSPGQANYVGNTITNIVNSGFVSEQGDWIYYRNDGDNGYLYKMKKDGSTKKKIADIPVANINVVGDWICFTQSSDYNVGGIIASIRTDGSNYRTYSSAAVNLYLLGNTMYYINLNDNHRIYKTNLDGSNTKKLNDYDSFNLIVTNSSLYYTVRTINDRHINTMSLNGENERTFIGTEHASQNGYEGFYLLNNVFYCVYGGYISSYNIDGTIISQCPDTIRVAYNNVESYGNGNGRVALYNGQIYYFNYDNFPQFNVVNCDLTNIRTLTNNPGPFPDRINIAAGWIYYRELKDNGKYVLKRMTLNGASMQYVN